MIVAVSKLQLSFKTDSGCPLRLHMNGSTATKFHFFLQTLWLSKFSVSWATTNMLNMIKSALANFFYSIFSDLFGHGCKIVRRDWYIAVSRNLNLHHFSAAALFHECTPTWKILFSSRVSINQTSKLGCANSAARFDKV
jgi:hypothetical protein